MAYLYSMLKLFPENFNSLAFLHRASNNLPSLDLRSFAGKQNTFSSNSTVHRSSHSRASTIYWCTRRDHTNWQGSGQAGRRPILCRWQDRFPVGSYRHVLCTNSTRTRSWRLHLSVFLLSKYIIEFNSGTIKIELDNTMWTVQPEQGRKG